jgi:aspartokinase
MIKISEAIREIIEGNPLFQWGLSHKLINLSQLARQILPMLEARTKKSIKESAILMNLSRLQGRYKKFPFQNQKYKTEKINVNSNLAIFSFSKTQEIHQKINTIYNTVYEAEGFMTISEGTTEITVIVDRGFEKETSILRGMKPKDEHFDISAVGVKIPIEHLDIPGFLYMAIQQLTLQNINIVEISSTCTELIFYIKETDTKLAFETIYNNLG